MIFHLNRLSSRNGDINLPYTAVVIGALMVNLELAPSKRKKNRKNYVPLRGKMVIAGNWKTIADSKLKLP